MSEQDGEDRPNDQGFPKVEEFVDFAGSRRRFKLELRPCGSGCILRAVEEIEGEGGYEFQTFGGTDPYKALAELRRKARRYLSVWHLIKEGASSRCLTIGCGAGLVMAAWR